MRPQPSPPWRFRCSRWSGCSACAPPSSSRSTYGEAVTAPTNDQIAKALATVDDPEIHKPITELGMVDSIEVAPDGKVQVHILLTIQGCPLRDKLQGDIT